MRPRFAPDPELVPLVPGDRVLLDGNRPATVVTREGFGCLFVQVDGWGNSPESVYAGRISRVATWGNSRGDHGVNVVELPRRGEILGVNPKIAGGK